MQRVLGDQLAQFRVAARNAQLGVGRVHVDVDGTLAAPFTLVETMHAARVQEDPRTVEPGTDRLAATAVVLVAKRIVEDPAVRQSRALKEVRDPLDAAGIVVAEGSGDRIVGLPGVPRVLVVEHVGSGVEEPAHVVDDLPGVAAERTADKVSRIDRPRARVHGKTVSTIRRSTFSASKYSRAMARAAAQCAE